MPEHIPEIACRFAFQWRLVAPLVLVAAIGTGEAFGEAADRLPCASYGGLAFLGADQARGRAFFLTVIAPPPYGFGADLSLRHSAVGTEVDAFSVATTPGLHLSTSPVLAPGEAGRHTLYEQTQGDCAIASATQDNALIELPDVGEGGGGSGGGGSGGGSGGGGTGGGGGAGTTHPKGSEQALLGTTSSPAFQTPYQISERLTDWGFLDAAEPDLQSRTWVQFDGVTFDDDRASRDGDGHWSMTTLGFDMVAETDSRAGIAIGYEAGQARAYGGATQAEFTGIAVGPYVAHRASPDLVLDLWLGYAQRDVDTQILDLAANYDVSRLFLSANATHRWRGNGFEGLGKLTFFAAHDDRDRHSYHSPGTALEVAGATDTSALIGLAAEIRRPPPSGRHGTIITPSARLGVNAWLQRPEDGAVYNVKLQLDETDDILLDAGVGLSIAMAKGGRFDLTVDYSGSGDGLDAISGQLAYRVNF